MAPSRILPARSPAGIGLLAALGWLAGPARAADPESFLPVKPTDLRVEAGGIVPAGAHAFSLREAGVRAIAPGTAGSGARISFTYRGPGRNAAPLASGELRRQIGLKLRSQDTCNIVYVMWHVAPTTGVHVQVKSNPGQKTHAECRDHGYRSPTPAWRRDGTPIGAGERHTLAASIEGRELRVLADGELVWRGRLSEEVFAFDGPIGIRSDNGEFDVELWAAPHHGAVGTR